MKKVCSGFTILVCTCTLAVAGAIVEQGVLAAQVNGKEQAVPAGSAKSPTISTVQVRKNARPSAKNSIAPTGSKQQSEVLRSRAKKTPALSKMPRPNGSSKTTIRKKSQPKAAVRPRTDLMHHGLLEDTRRYDPRPNYRTAGVQNPQTSSLTHDHFQELDRNQDGKIDPVERAFSRLDIDRDLQGRQLQ
jgi:hypothetical protein